MGKNKNKNKRSGFNTQKIYKFIRIAALILPAAERALGPGTPMQKLNLVKRDYFGIGTDGKWYPHLMARGWVPVIAATAVTYAVPKIAGLIRGL